MWLVLCNGRVFDFPKVTRLELRLDEVWLIANSQAVGKFDRRDVYACTTLECGATPG
jgi:hypothetical protein